MSDEAVTHIGRPTDYSDELADTICERLMDGESLRAICDSEGFPKRTTVFRWLAIHPLFSDKYAKAKQEQAEALADEIMDIADDGRNDYMARLDKEGNETGYMVNGEAIARSRLRVDSRKWVASKLLPKKYGEFTRTEVTGADGGPISTESNVTLTPSDAYMRMINAP